MTRWFTSDFHFLHVRILEYCPWNRPFDKVEDMNLFLLDTWNSVVDDDDDVYFMGDFAMKFTAVEEFLPQLNGCIHWVPGNHDAIHKMHKGAAKTREKVIKLNPNIVDISEVIIIPLGKHKLVLNHFGWEGVQDDHSEEHNSYDDRYSEWKLPRKDYPKHICLKGHTHSRPEDKIGNRQIDVGFDPWGRMVSEEDILAIIEKEGW